MDDIFGEGFVDVEIQGTPLNTIHPASTSGGHSMRQRQESTQTWSTYNARHVPLDMLRRFTLFMGIAMAAWGKAMVVGSIHLERGEPSTHHRIIWIIFVMHVAPLAAFFVRECRVSLLEGILTNYALMSTMPGAPMSDRGQAWVPEDLIAFSFDTRERCDRESVQGGGGPPQWIGPAHLRCTKPWTEKKLWYGKIMYGIVTAGTLVLFAIFDPLFSIFLTLLYIVTVVAIRYTAACAVAIAFYAFGRDNLPCAVPEPGVYEFTLLWT